ncbi:MAG TPA: HAD family phosphatase [Bryobacteraceae bacterium]|nr:HAD family phosphatase [Bryobacteraceae bacterium]
MIKTVIFDLGRVLVDFDFMRGYKTMSAMSGLDVEEVRRRFHSSGIANEFESGVITEREFEERTQRMLGTSIPHERFEEIWFSVFLPGTLMPEAVVEGIRRNHRTLLLSNTNAMHFRGLKQQYRILDHFDAYVLSHEVGAMKPQPAIYEAAIRAAGCQPGECFFTDDVAEYAEGARRHGIDAVQFTGAAQAMEELSRRGVSW